MAFEAFIGARYLRTKQKQTFVFLITLLAVVGVTVGVMALIVVIAVMSGFESDLKSRILGIEAHVVLKRHGTFAGYQPVIDRVGFLEGVEAAAAFVDGQIMARSSSRTSGAVVRGIDPEAAGEMYGRLDPSLLGVGESSPGETGKAQIPKIILGRELAGSLGVVDGDHIHAISPGGTISPIGHLPGMKRFQVVGVFDTGVPEYDGSLTFIHIRDAQDLFRMGDAATGIAVQVDDIYQAREIADRITGLLGSSYWAEDWIHRNQNLFSALKLERIAMFVILGLIILVAAFNIAGTLIMMVMEKSRDIAILKAMGSSRQSIRKIFVFKGLAIGLIGVVTGASLGALLCVLLKHYKFIELPEDVYYITTLPVQLGLSDVSMIAVAAVVICFLATLYPAHRASKLDPIEALRHG